MDGNGVVAGPGGAESQERGGVDGSSGDSVTASAAADVAEAGYEGLMAGETVVDPSRSMRRVDLLGRMTPRPLVRRVAHLVNGDR